MKRLQGFFSGLPAKYRNLGIALAVALVASGASAQTSDAAGAFTEFDGIARGLIGNWGSVAVGLTALWVGVKLGPKFIKRLTSAV